MASAYGPWVGGDDWRSWVEITVKDSTSDPEKATVNVKGYITVDAGSSSGSGNVRGWVGVWGRMSASATDGSYSWYPAGSSYISIDPFTSSKYYIGNSNANSGHDFTVYKTHEKQTIWGYADIEGKAGIYNGTKSQAVATVTIPAKTSYKVTYNANGGSNAPSAQTKWHGENLTLQKSAPTRSGYTFVGWATSNTATSAAASASQYGNKALTAANMSAGVTYSGNAALTLYAVWSKTLTLTYNANSGSNAPSAQSATIYNATTSYKFTISSTVPTRTGYNFLGWATSNTATSASYSTGGNITISSNTTLYAVWQRKTYAITYNANKPSAASGSVSNMPSNQTKTHGTAITLSTKVPTLSAYRFIEWRTAANGTGTAYNPGNSYSTEAALSLYAKWQVANPSLTIISAYRADSNYNPSDEGGNAVITINASSQIGAELSFVVTVGSFDSVSSPYASSGSVYTFHVPASMLTDNQYAVSVQATDTSGSTTKTTIIQTAWYAIDIRNGGHGIAFGKVASTDYLADFGMSIRSDTGMSIVHSNANESATFTSIRSDTNKSISFGVGDDGVNRGIWDNSQSKWILYVNSSGNTNVSGLTADSIPSLAASKIGSGTLADARIPNLAASKINSGTFDTARIPSLAASKINSGTFDAARIPSLSAQGKFGWVSLGNVTSNATQTNALDLTLTGYEELLILCRNSTTYNASIVVKVSWLSSTARDYYLGGWYRTATYASAIKLTTTKATPYQAYVNGSAVNATWYFYGR